MKDIGQTLKNERIAKGMTLEEVADMTKISVRYLQSIENNDLSALPGKFYIKGFIRNYAKAIDFDIEPYLSEPVDSEKAEEANVSPNIKSTTSQPVRERKFGKLFALSLLAVLLSLIVVTIYKYYETDKSSESQIPGNNIESNEIDEIEPLPEKPLIPDKPATNPSDNINENTNITVTLDSQDAITNFYNISEAEKFKLVIDSAAGSCWYELRENNNFGEIISSQSFKQGDIFEVDLKSGFWLRLGNPDAINIYINEQLIDKESVTQPRNYQFDID